MYNLLMDPYESINSLDTTLSISEKNAKDDLESELAIIRN